MRVYRLCRLPFRALDGEGARLYGGRWTRPGLPAIYTSSTLSLAAIEYLIHLDPESAPSDLVALAIEVPDGVPLRVIKADDLRSGWNSLEGTDICRRVGDEWLADGHVPVLRVPAAPIPEEFNVLLNPRHALAVKWKIVASRPFAYDPRLLE